MHDFSPQNFNVQDIRVQDFWVQDVGEWNISVLDVCHQGFRVSERKLPLREACVQHLRVQDERSRNVSAVRDLFLWEISLQDVHVRYVCVHYLGLQNVSAQDLCLHEPRLRDFEV